MNGEEESQPTPEGSNMTARGRSPWESMVQAKKAADVREQWPQLW
ncbi:MAG: hypothetical protein WCL44_09175 [bacterium]